MQATQRRCAAEALTAALTCCHAAGPLVALALSWMRGKSGVRPHQLPSLAPPRPPAQSEYKRIELLYEPVYEPAMPCCAKPHLGHCAAWMNPWRAAWRGIKAMCSSPIHPVAPSEENCDNLATEDVRTCVEHFQCLPCSASLRSACACDRLPLQPWTSWVGSSSQRERSRVVMPDARRCPALPCACRRR